MRSQLFFLCCLALGCLAFGLEIVDEEDSEDTLEEILDDSGRLRNSVALKLLQNDGLSGTAYGIPKIPAPLKALAVVGTLAKIAVLVLIGTGTIPTTIGNTTIPEPVVALANATTAVLMDLKALLADANTVTGIVEIDENSNKIIGELFLAQSTSSTGGAATLVTGTLKGLTAGTSYRVDVTTSGNLVNGCSAAGAVYSTASGGVFTADSNGRALLVVRMNNAPLSGNASVMGRSIVITTVANTTVRLACGTIVRG